jgi:para-nitrobenzyl esterase
MEEPMWTTRQKIARLGSIALLTLFIAACGAEQPTSSDGAPPPKVTVDTEILEGTYMGPTTSEVVFKGIPYAAPPVGDLRWQPPVSHTPRDGVQTAIEFATPCVQPPWNVGFQRNIARIFGTDPDLVPPLAETSEDCLHLNVWSPNFGGNELLPVMFWIHGGSNVSGAGSDGTYDGKNLAGKGVVVVTVNYRLNVLGFFAHPALTDESERGVSGNYGLLDQIAALKWVQRNIAAFGGDPELVTIFGESAGAVDVGYLMASPLADGLFHRAISQSGGYTIAETRTLDDVEAQGVQLVEKLGMSDEPDVLGAMRAKDAQELMAETFAAFPKGVNLGPAKDGWFLPEAPGHVFSSGKQHDVPMMIGANADEWTALRFFDPEYTVESFRVALRWTYGKTGERAEALYAVSSDEELRGAIDRWMTDLVFVGPSVYMARMMENVPSPAYFFVFSRRLPAPGGEELGAYHAAELPYVWDNLDLNPWVPREDYDKELAEIMSSYWVQFAATGDPNGGDLPNWPPFSTDAENYLDFGDVVEARKAFRSEQVEVYSSVLETAMEKSR